MSAQADEAAELLVGQPGHAEIDCAGTTLLESGPRLVDFARAKAFRHPGGVELTVRNTSGADFLTYSLLQAGAAGYDASADIDDGGVTIHCVSNGKPVPPSPSTPRCAASGWTTSTCTRPTSGTRRPTSTN